jgi:SAM-dependent methyltransferase
MNLITATLIVTLLGPALGNLFECPTEVGKAKNDVADYFEYFDKYIAYNVENISGFRDSPYGGRDNTYSEMKDMVSPFKEEVFGENLKNGDIIYESACGEGLNLLMTLEILREKNLFQRPTHNLTVYGNDYLAESIAIANTVFRQEAPEYMGKFCRGDSTNLSFVPSDTFDLAYTGFLDPLIDPLQMAASEDMDHDEIVEHSIALCDSPKPFERKLAAAEQLAQEDWHSKWVTELVRIVKPGKIVVIEDVGYPLCSSPESEWGGVSVEWWTEAVDKYGWDVDSESIRIILAPWYDNRYNVVMRRNKDSDKEVCQPSPVDPSTCRAAP